jgi:hypothetical protein
MSETWRHCKGRTAVFCGCVNNGNIIFMMRSRAMMAIRKKNTNNIEIT